MRFVLVEIERFGKLAVGVYELHAVFLDEVANLHLAKHIETFKDPVSLRNQRFADVEPWIVFALEKLYFVAGIGDERRHGRAGRPAANHNHVAIMLPLVLVSISASSSITGCIEFTACAFLGFVRSAGGPQQLDELPQLAGPQVS